MKDSRAFRNKLDHDGNLNLIMSSITEAKSESDDVEYIEASSALTRTDRKHKNMVDFKTLQRKCLRLSTNKDTAKETREKYRKIYMKLVEEDKYTRTVAEDYAGGLESDEDFDYEQCIDIIVQMDD